MHERWNSTRDERRAAQGRIAIEQIVEETVYKDGFGNDHYVDPYFDLKAEHDVAIKKISPNAKVKPDSTNGAKKHI